MNQLEAYLTAERQGGVRRPYCHRVRTRGTMIASKQRHTTVLPSYATLALLPASGITSGGSVTFGLSLRRGRFGDHLNHHLSARGTLRQQHFRHKKAMASWPKVRPKATIGTGNTLGIELEKKYITGRAGYFTHSFVVVGCELARRTTTNPRELELQSLSFEMPKTEQSHIATASKSSHTRPPQVQLTPRTFVKKYWVKARMIRRSWPTSGAIITVYSCTAF